LTRMNAKSSPSRRLPNVHPGEVLLEDFLKPLGLSQYRLAADLGIPESRVSEIVRGARGVTADTALRLARYFRTSHELWLNLQDRYDVEETQRAKHREIEKIRPHAAVA
ncbi:MAG: HigA family addiction module antitoxin, partial [Opitutales bacterium]